MMADYSERPPQEDEPARLPPENAREQLARILREKMEHLDPTFSGELVWEDLPDRDREFYRHCVAYLMLHSEVVHACLSQLSHGDNPEDGG
jgi:hypothetical protein